MKNIPFLRTSAQESHDDTSVCYLIPLYNNLSLLVMVKGFHTKRVIEHQTELKLETKILSNPTAIFVLGGFREEKTLAQKVAQNARHLQPDPFLPLCFMLFESTKYNVDSNYYN